MRITMRQANKLMRELAIGTYADEPHNLHPGYTLTVICDFLADHMDNFDRTILLTNFSEKVYSMHHINPDKENCQLHLT